MAKYYNNMVEVFGPPTVVASQKHGMVLWIKDGYWEAVFSYKNGIHPRKMKKFVNVHKKICQ